MILKIEINLDELMGNWSGLTLDELVHEEIRTTIKKDPYFKAAVKEKSNALVDKMTKELTL